MPIPALTLRVAASCLALLSVTAGCGSTEDVRVHREPSSDGDAHLAHEAYTTAINSNDIEALMEMMTDDVVFLAPHAPPMVGKAEVRPWAEGYYDAYQTHWEKDSLEFVVAGEWAFERYAWRSTDTPKDGGETLHDTGWGLVIYHHDADGRWRVARDAFGTDQPLPAGG